jgi:hypothetical protein
MSTKKQITYAEPADRPLSINLSPGEIHALIKHHEKSAKTAEKAAIKYIGQWKLNGNPKVSDLNAIKKHAESRITAHYKRAQGLSSILQSHLES